MPHFLSANTRSTGERHAFEHDGRERAYRIYVPSSYAKATPVPAVFCFHGGGGDAEKGSIMGLTPIAEAEGFIAVYPEGMNRHWNDGRNSAKFAEQDSEVDDVAFVLALLDHLEKEYSLDPKRLFVTGPSNGGFFTQRMALEASDRFAAAATIIATMPDTFSDPAKTKPKAKIPVLFMNGTEDPFVPYEGGPITPEFFPGLNRLRKPREHGRGSCSSTDEAVKFWITHNELSEKGVSETLENRDPSDGCSTVRTTWSGDESGLSVVLYRIEGGGHTLPGGQQYLPERVIGRTCRDIEAWETIWEFFKTHPKN